MDRARSRYCSIREHVSSCARVDFTRRSTRTAPASQPPQTVPASVNPDCVGCGDHLTGEGMTTVPSHPCRPELLRRGGVGGGPIAAAKASARVYRMRLVSSSPLIRRRDRTSAWFVVLAIVAAGTVLPFAASMGTAIQQTAVVTAEHQLRTHHRIPVTTLAEASSPVAGPSPGAATAPVRWRWHARSFRARTVVPPGTPPGAQLTKWVDDHGRLSGAPLSTSEAMTAAREVTAAIWTVTALLLVLLVRAVRNATARAQDRDWDRDHELLLGVGNH